MPAAATGSKGNVDGDRKPQPADNPIDSRAAAPDADCPADCGCGSACECGCCVLLGWARWTDHLGWVVLHKGVRRFVRPQLIADPIDDQASIKS
ncbi:MAG: hypothetical protein WDN24_20055 [Sphingomonas sp.]